MFPIQVSSKRYSEWVSMYGCVCVCVFEWKRESVGV